MKLFNVNKIVASMIVVGFTMPVAFAEPGKDYTQGAVDDVIFTVDTNNGGVGDFIVKKGSPDSAVEILRSGSKSTTISTVDGSKLTFDDNGLSIKDKNGKNIASSGLQVEDGTLAVDSKDAVNGKQLNKVDIKADAAQDTADQAIINAKAADDKAVAAQGTANTALNNAKTADDKAVAAQNDLNDYRTQTDTTLGLHAGRISQNETDIIGLKSDVADIRHDLRNQKDEYRAGIASLAAMTNIPTVPGKTFSAGMGVGNFKNKTAFAAGANWNVNENVSTKFSVGFESSDVTIGTGVAFGF